jgi:hypothetical protein
MEGDTVGNTIRVLHPGEYKNPNPTFAFSEFLTVK